jgi:hypothetical protein
MNLDDDFYHSAKGKVEVKNKYDGEGRYKENPGYPG